MSDDRNFAQKIWQSVADGNDRLWAVEGKVYVTGSKEDKKQIVALDRRIGSLVKKFNKRAMGRGSLQSSITADIEALAETFRRVGAYRVEEKKKDTAARIVEGILDIATGDLPGSNSEIVKVPVAELEYSYEEKTMSGRKVKKPLFKIRLGA